MPQTYLLNSDDTTVDSPDVPQEPHRWLRLSGNLRAFLSRLLPLAWKPKRFASPVIDYWFLIRSIWSGRQLGPDVIYPLSSIRKRQSGHLARLLLEHCKAVSRYKFRTQKVFAQGIDPPCVTVIDLDDVAQNTCCTQVDLHGFMCMLILVETLVTFTICVFYSFDRDRITWLNWVHCAVINLTFVSHAVFRGDGTLTLAQRSDTSTPGCIVLLDQEFFVVMNGSHGVVEAIGESCFTLSHPNSVWRLRLGGNKYGLESSYHIVEELCEGVCLTIFMSCWLLFHPSTTLGVLAPLVAVSIIVAISIGFPPRDLGFLQGMWFLVKGIAPRLSFPFIVFLLYEPDITKTYFSVFDRSMDVHLFSIVLFVLFFAGYKTRDYPIRSAKLLDALGQPSVRKWQFDTLAAAVTFQCLVLCRGAARPVGSIDILAFLDMLVPDQRDVWKAWKGRVADRIVHETDISFTLTIPTFPDERQQQLKDLLDEAQLGNDVYRLFYELDVLPESCRW